MAANDLEEGMDTFSFDEWLSVSGLSALKDILIKHEMTSIKALSTESTEFAAFISDPLLLPRAMLIPQAIQSMQQLQNSYKDNLIKGDKETPQSPSNNSSSSDQEADTEKTKDIIAKQDNTNNPNDNDDDGDGNNDNNDDNDDNKDNKDLDNEGTNDNAEDDNDNDNDNDNNNNIDDMESLYAKFEEYKKEKEAHRKASKGSLGSLSSLISMDNDLSKLADKQRKLSNSKPSIIREKTERKKRKMVKLKEGDYVRFVNDKSKEGIVRFVGETEFDDGIFYGVELTSGDGDCDGSFDDVSYFQCEDNKGVFVKRRILRRIAPKTSTKLLTSQSTNAVMIRDRKDSVDSIRSYQSDISDIDNLSVLSKKKNKKRKKKKKKRDKNKSEGKDAKTEKLASREKWKNKIKRKKKQRKNQSRPATLGAVDFSAMFNDRGGSASTKKKDDDYYKKARQELRKAGPRQIGKIKYKGIKHDKKRKKKRKPKVSMDDISDLESDDIYTDDDELRQRKEREKEREREKIKQELKKAGPRQIGKIKYKGLKLSKEQKKELEKSKFLDENLSHKTRKLKKDVSYDGTSLFGAKQGPQQIGKIKYKGTKLSKKQKDDLQNGLVLEAKLHHTVSKKRKLHRRAKSLIGSKLGPLDMGKTNYKGTKLDPNLIDDQNGDILSEKTHIIIKKKWQLGKGINSANPSNIEHDYDLSSDSDDNYNYNYDDDVDDNDNNNNNNNIEDDTIYVEYNQEKSSSDDDIDDNALSLRPKRKNTNNNKKKTKRLNSPRTRNRTKSKQRQSSPKKKKSPKKVRSPRKAKSPRISNKDNKYDDSGNDTDNDKRNRLSSPRSRKRDGGRKISKSPNRKPSKLRNIRSSPTPSPARTPINDDDDDGNDNDNNNESPISPASDRSQRSPKSPVITDNDTDNDYDDDKRMKRHKRKKKDKKDKKKKKRKDKNKDDHVNKYKKKLKAKQKSNPVPRHYASESDQEYIETVKNNVFVKEDEDQVNIDDINNNNNNNNKSQPPSLVQSRSISPKNSSLIASPKEFVDYNNINNVETSPPIKQEEIAHYVHNVDTSEESDTDIDDNGSLNALSSDDEDQVHNTNNNGTNQEKRWI